MDIHDTLQEAISLLDGARPRAFGAGAVVDRDRLLQLLNHARETLPEEILAAASILAQRTQIVAGAQQEAEQLRAAAQGEADQTRAAALADAEACRSAATAEAENARSRAQREREALVDEHEILMEAQSRADALLTRAHHQSASMRAEVDAYVDAKLAAIAATLGKTLDTIETGRRKVRAQSETAVDETVSLA